MVALGWGWTHYMWQLWHEAGKCPLQSFGRPVCALALVVTLGNIGNCQYWVKLWMLPGDCVSCHLYGVSQCSLLANPDDLVVRLSSSGFVGLPVLLLFLCTIFELHYVLSWSWSCSIAYIETTLGFTMSSPTSRNVKIKCQWMHEKHIKSRLHPGFSNI